MIRNTENVMGQMAAIGKAEAMCGVGITAFLRGLGTLGARWFGTACPTYQHGAKYDCNLLSSLSWDEKERSRCFKALNGILLHS